MYSKLTKRNFPWMMFFLNIELHQSIVAFTAFYSHDMSPNNIQEYPEYIQSISRVSQVSICSSIFQDIELNELQAFRADYMKFRAGQAALGSGDPNGPNGALGPWDLEIRVLKYIEG
jgi:hypothetical protein